jgi:hypothetical protein
MEDSVIVGDPLVGELDMMCSVQEAQLRTETRQVDRFELSASAPNGQVVIDLQKAVKKYQRSSADKKYLATEVRTVGACWRTVEYLINNLLDFDVNPKPGYADICYSSSSSFWEIYSFLRDRLRAVRVDLHVQNASTNPLFVTVHEICLRFELLSLFLLWGRDFGDSDDRKFDLHLSLTALSQTIDPLANAYAIRANASNEETQREAEITSYILLLSLTSRGGSKTFKGHFLKQPELIRNHSLVIEAYETVSDYYAGNWVSFLERYSKSSFLAACCMLPVVNIARTKILWRVVRTNRPFFVRKDPSAGPMPAPRPEKISPHRFREMLGFATVDECEKFLASMGIAQGVPPRQLTRNPITWWTSSADWREKANDNRDFPDFQYLDSDLEAFHSQIGEDVGDENSPDRCDFSKTVERILEDKYMRLSSRKGIVLGSAVNTVGTPLVTHAPVPVPLAPIKGMLEPTPTFFPKTANIIAPAPEKPQRPVVPLQPLVLDDVFQKRPRDSPEKEVPIAPKPPQKKLHETVPLEPLAVVEVPLPVVPMPSLPSIESGFEILAAELSRVVISRTAPTLTPPMEDLFEETSDEQEISRRRLKYVALKCLRNWQTVTNASYRWKWLLGSTTRAPARINP